jgi:2-polyprenyl-6-methoxyphenol hydroxylase-like FAD-dependent oxidoreductase
MPDPQVLIVGAGPTGLVLALWLTRLGVRVRVIDKTAEPGTTSRALVVHARTLEFYRQVGLANEVVRQGREFVAANLWVKSRRVGRLGFGAMGQGLSPFPYMLIYPQDEHEKMLIQRLAQAGVAVERSTEFLQMEDHGDQILARLRTPDGAEQTLATQFVAGCDGAHSTVRNVIGAGFPGGTYAHLFYVADAAATGAVINGELHVALDEADLLAVFPLKRTGSARLIGTVREEALPDHNELSWNDVNRTVIDRLGITVERVNWFSTYHVHHRVADRFRQGRVFLLGDAAHIHSPVGGQGMNTGIGDAVNLAWKLAAVLRGRCALSILDTYELERIAFARRLVATTDRAFTVVTSPGRIARVVRVFVAPVVLPALFKSTAVRRFMFRTVSQIAINYRHSSFSQGSAGRILAGDRLPWVPNETPANTTQDNFAPLESLDWQVHVYGLCDSRIGEHCRKIGLAFHNFRWSIAAAQAGIEQSALYLVRPDGYIGLASAEASPRVIDDYFNTRCIQYDAYRQTDTGNK